MISSGPPSVFQDLLVLCSCGIPSDLHPHSDLVGASGTESRYSFYRHRTTDRGTPDDLLGTYETIFVGLMSLSNDTRGRFHAFPQQKPLDPRNWSSDWAAVQRSWKDELQRYLAQEYNGLFVRRAGLDESCVVSRISVQIQPGKIHEAVYEAVELLTTEAQIFQIKVTEPGQIGKGPDDLILYLATPLGSPGFTRIVEGMVNRNVGKDFLAVATQAPIGASRLGNGLFGADLPAVDVLATRRFTGSLGNDRAIICTHAYERAIVTGEDVATALRATLQAVGLDPDAPERRKASAGPKSDLDYSQRAKQQLSQKQ